MASPTSLSALRVLILSPHQFPTSPSPFPPLLSALTSTPTSSDLTSFAGYTSHPPLRLKTKYYERDVGIWCDELPPVSAPSRRGTGASVPSGGAGGVGSPIALGGGTELVVSPSNTDPVKLDALLASSEAKSPAAPAPTSTSTSTEPAPQVSSISSTTIPDPRSATTPSTFSIPPATAPLTTSEEEDPPTLSAWKTSLLSPPFAPVLSSLGAIILILPIPPHADYPATPAERVSLMEYMSAVNEVKDAVEDVGRDVGGVFLLVPETPPSKGEGVTKVVSRLEGLAEKFEDKCHEMGVFGWDFVCWDGVAPALAQAQAQAQPHPPASAPVPPSIDSTTETTTQSTTTSATSNPPAASSTTTSHEPTTRNAFGEKLGIPRVLEILEAVDWSITPSTTFVEDPTGGETEEKDEDFDVFTGSKFQGLDAELQREMMGLKMSMLDSRTGNQGIGEDGVERVAGAGVSHGLGLGRFEQVGQGSGEGGADGEEMSIDQMSKLMERVVAIKEAGSEMERGQREEFAKREVQKIMRELS